MKSLFCILGVFLLGTLTVGAQEVQVSPNNRTISVTVKDSVQVEAEIAEVSVGYTNYGPTRDATFDGNVRAADKIALALLGAGVAKTNIETKSLRLEPVTPEDNWPTEMQKQRQFQATQAWTIRVPVADAQHVVDLAIAAGANQVEDVEWEVADPRTLEAKAGAAALAKARAVAQQMAASLGANLGELLYASNYAPAPRGLFQLGALNTSASVIVRRIETPGRPLVKLFPRKVESEATVHAVFALQ